MNVARCDVKERCDDRAEALRIRASPLLAYRKIVLAYRMNVPDGQIFRMNVLAYRMIVLGDQTFQMNVLAYRMIVLDGQTFRMTLLTYRMNVQDALTYQMNELHVVHLHHDVVDGYCDLLQTLRRESLALRPFQRRAPWQIDEDCPLEHLQSPWTSNQSASESVLRVALSGQLNASLYALMQLDLYLNSEQLWSP
jgi:hypothetical protein